eukprot:CAMPEP_0119127058 /NCGR_PEP_ID=MMETSP1310-20130426/5747_1 /TAXON_ID=464262 /ORGANISM="Genus nov. species nov., Strain RCC2339" /LENGTH=315 /DNA_ID=CAMNT_0007117279 /DNA_START=76 /DNA_END=1019 /DNA_ORIENTATION=-
MSRGWHFFLLAFLLVVESIGTGGTVSGLSVGTVSGLSVGKKGWEGNGDSEACRNVSGMVRIQQCLAKKLILPVDDAVGDTRWTDTAVYGGLNIRVYLPSSFLVHANKNITRLHSRVVVGIHSTSREVALRQSVRETFGSKLLTYFLIGDPTESLWSEALGQQDIIILGIREVYGSRLSSLSLKTLLWLQLASRASTRGGPWWIAKGDTDTFFFARGLARALLHLHPSQRIIAGRMISGVSPIRGEEKWNIDYDIYPGRVYPPYAAGGSGYVLSKPAARCVGEAVKSDDFGYNPLEDVSVGLVLNKVCKPYKFQLA